MHKDGHIGLTLLIFSITYHLCNAWDERFIEILLIALAFSVIPDYDLKIQKLGLKNSFKTLAILLTFVSLILFAAYGFLTKPYLLYVATLSTALAILFLFLFAMSEHRKFSHTIFFGLICGAFTGFFTLKVFEDFYIGFYGAFLGVFSHILGDLFTYTPFSPLYPILKRKFSLKLFKSSNQIVNKVMLIVGLTAFVLLYQGGTVLKLALNYS
ncbi:metal-dependent hydrolase [Archaeoglobus profundus]|uniref:Membrane-bound metal-dependent hydrolase n=1 Tax=Archaeoglobus profundus (strain DSM 5631 / JCM 9629 / NBRC 100127 / Av18) TaxID=572546 RepID=D2RDF3_ARCPA|nr:metal-dependent hydrolase [Archaeoglobus profundus]ADB58147.1 membrane-bound metal-dependent hydrolase [Archaeoglobus profundus DSM 5631]